MQKPKVVLPKIENPNPGLAALRSDRKLSNATQSKMRSEKPNRPRDVTKTKLSQHTMLLRDTEEPSPTKSETNIGSSKWAKLCKEKAKPITMQSKAKSRNPSRALLKTKKGESSCSTLCEGMEESICK